MNKFESSRNSRLFVIFSRRSLLKFFSWEYSCRNENLAVMMAFLLIIFGLNLLGLLVVHQRWQGSDNIRVKPHANNNPNNIKPFFENCHWIDVSKTHCTNCGNGPIERYLGLLFEFNYPNNGCYCQCTLGCRSASCFR